MVITYYVVIHKHGTGLLVQLYVQLTGTGGKLLWAVCLFVYYVLSKYVSESAGVILIIVD